MSSSDTLYLPYKVVGVVVDNAPFVVNAMGEETFLTAPIGKMFQVFRADRLTPVLVSKAAPGPISMLQVRSFVSRCMFRLTVVCVKLYPSHRPATRTPMLLWITLSTATIEIV
jgi:hypothetical protein